MSNWLSYLKMASEIYTGDHFSKLNVKLRQNRMLLLFDIVILEGQKVIFTNILCFLSTVLGFSTLVLPIGNFFTENIDLL